MREAFESRWYQGEAEQSIFDYFDKRAGMPGNPVVALPTGTGKSVVIANFVRRVLSQWPNQRIMMLTHVKELIEQNASKLIRVWPTVPLGIYSAGLKQRDVMFPIIYGGVASVKNIVAMFGHRDLLLIDEAHLLSDKDDSMYQAVIAELLKVNPYLKVIGFTATPFRMKQGMITDGGIFTDVCYNGTTPAMFNRLIAEGFISPPIPKRTDTFIDVSNVKIVGGEYAKGELEAAADKDEITYAAVKETVELGANRRSWLMFASGIQHSEHVAEMLRTFGIAAAAVHSGLDAKENDRRIAALKTGELRAVVNMGKLTTGFDHPPIDLIGMLRPTNSPGLWVQMLGRGTRPSPETGKQNCLVLDFARNTPRLGPINDPVLPRKPGKGGGDAPVRICTTGTDANGQRVNGCGCYNHASIPQCINCGINFDFETKIYSQAGTEELLRTDEAVVKYFKVSHVLYNLHEKQGSPPMIKVSYFCGLQMFNEYINFESPIPLVRHRAHNFWKQRHKEPPPLMTFQALALASELRMPSRIRVRVDKQYPEVLSYEF